MINKEQKDDMLHALGRPNIRKDWKPETILRKAYRNKYLTYNKDKSWEDLINKGYANKMIQRHQSKGIYYFYYVNEAGVKELQEMG